MTYMSLEDFERSLGLGAGRGISSPQFQELKKLQPGQAVRLSHEGLAHHSSGCGIQSLASRQNKLHTDRRYSVKHIEGGDVLVACYPKGVAS